MPPAGDREGFLRRSLTGDMQLSQMTPVYRLV